MSSSRKGQYKDSTSSSLKAKLAAEKEARVKAETAVEKLKQKLAAAKNALKKRKQDSADEGDLDVPAAETPKQASAKRSRPDTGAMDLVAFFKGTEVPE